MKKRIFSIFVLLLMLLTLPVAVSAHDVPDVTRKDCTIDVVLWDRAKDKGIVGAELVCYRIGYVDDDGNGNYYFYDINTDKVIPDKDVQSSTAAEEFAYFVKEGKYKEVYKETFEKEGIYYFTKLPTGLYLVTQKKAASGYSDMDPFLVTIPYMYDGEYQYEITAKVKTEVEQEIDPTTPTSPKPSGGKLPQTGQLTWPIPWLAASGMILFAFGWWLCFGRRKDFDEE